MTTSSSVPDISQQAVLVTSDTSFITDKNIIRGYDFNNGVDYDRMFECFKYTGFQATALANAIEEVNKMVC
jgi:deoxyhypusine synthase